jgi:alpha-glucosidase (family GH31 glycosyl hydrolase)
MKRIKGNLVAAGLAVLLSAGCSGLKPSPSTSRSGASLVLHSLPLADTGHANGKGLKLDGLYFETTQGRVRLPGTMSLEAQSGGGDSFEGRAALSDGRKVLIEIKPHGDDFDVHIRASPDADIVKWGLSFEAKPEEYFTGLMERVVDGPQQASWSPGRKEAMNLRGQKVDMIIKPTASVYAPFYISSLGYGVFVHGHWPGVFDFCKSDSKRVRIEFEGPSFELKIYTADNPAALVSRHALDAGPPFLPPKWMFSPWRWRDEHTQRTNYFDGTPVSGPFNSEAMEDLLMMKAFGIPCGVYWIDRPWGPGRLGYDDFEIDAQRLPNFAAMVKWLEEQQTKTVLWIGPFYQGKMEREALAKGYNLAGQPPLKNNYPMVDFTNPDAKKYWQDGVAKLLKLGVAGFKLDRAEEQIPESGPFKVFDGRSIRENRNAYPPMYVQATYEVAQKYRGEDFVLMPRAAYTGTAAYSVNWGGDIGGTQEGLRASIIAVQRAAVMGYPNWGSDTCGYTSQLLEQEVCGRWLAFSCFTPIMEVGPTKNVAFWNLPREPKYDAELIAIWRLYARLHQRLADYGHALAQEAHQTGLPIVRPLFLVEPKSPHAWSNWWTYLYGPDLVVSPIWEKNKRTQEVYLPGNTEWRDAWQPEKIYHGGTSVSVHAELHQIPIFTRVGSTLDLGDLNQEWRESIAIAQKKPDLKSLEAEVSAWFKNHEQAVGSR